MKITETRKQILELIEPYIDKTLDDLCLCEYSSFDDDIGEDVVYNIDYVVCEYSCDRDNRSKIYGNYDITAVLKYIQFNDNICSYKLYSLAENIEIEFNLKNGEYIDEKIPNKPLHLYTDEEDKNLLELLKELGKQ